MATEKQLIVVPHADFPVATLPFGVVTGEGVDNYEGDGKEYTASVILGKKEAKHLKKEVLAFWEAHKGKVKADEPANYANVVRTDDNGVMKAYFKSVTHFGDKANIVAVVDAKRNPLSVEDYGMFGGESTGRIAVQLAIYSGGKSNDPKGVSMFLSAVQLSTFEKLTSGGGAKAFGEEEGDAIAEHGFSDDKKEKKEKKAKKSKK